MLFKKDFGELVRQSLSYLSVNTSITNTNVGGITRSLLEIVNKNISEYYDVLDLNTTMSFLSTAEGYFLDLIGVMFNMPRILSSAASSSSIDGVQKFYVATGVLYDKIPSGVIPAGTLVSTPAGDITYTVTTNTVFSSGVNEVYVPIKANNTGTKYNVPVNTLVATNIGIANVFTANSKAIVSGTDSESDGNYRYRLMNATLAAEKANEIAIRLAALSVYGVANVIMRPFARGIGTYDVVVIPVDGIATDSLINSVQAAIDRVQAYGVRGMAIKPTIVPVDIEVKLVFNNNVTDFQKSDIRSVTRSAIEKYIVNIPLGGTFILNELRQQIMDVSPKIKDHIINCFCFREEPTFIGNVECYWDEMFYPNPKSPDSINVI